MPPAFGHHAEEHVAARQALRIRVLQLAVRAVNGGEPLRCRAGHGHPPEAAGRGRSRKHNRVVGAPGGTPDRRHVANLERSTAVDRDPLEGAVGVKADPASVGRKERRAGALSAGDGRRLEAIERSHEELRAAFPLDRGIDESRAVGRDGERRQPAAFDLLAGRHRHDHAGNALPVVGGRSGVRQSRHRGRRARRASRAPPPPATAARLREKRHGSTPGICTMSGVLSATASSISRPASAMSCRRAVGSFFRQRLMSRCTAIGACDSTRQSGSSRSTAASVSEIVSDANGGLPLRAS